MERKQALVQEIEQVADQVEQAVSQASAEQWSALTGSEQWPLGLVARHIAYGYLMARRWIETMAAGDDVTMTLADIDQANAANRGAAPDPPEQTLEFLRKARQRLIQQVQQLSETQLDEERYFGVAERRLPIEGIVRLAIRHPRGHLESIRHTLQATAV
jgi:uncharacterized damage-inducible protein DinB